MTDEHARYGWQSDFDTFRSAQPRAIREALSEYVTDASIEQKRAWADSIPPLQAEVEKSVVANELARDYSAILEYMLPMESRRPDVILLVGSNVMVVELKGKLSPSQADLDQVAAYARDLRNYHRECSGRSVVPVLVPTRATGDQGKIGTVHVTGPDALNAVVAQLTQDSADPAIDRARFLDSDAYCPLPTLVQAARELMADKKTLRVIHRARAETQPAIDEIARIAHHAAETQTRHLVLLTGVPGAGKTLVGLQTVHASYLDDLRVPREGQQPTTSAIFLSGNRPLVEVLQYELSRSRKLGEASSDGKVFVRHVQDYVRQHTGPRGKVPNEHVLVFDEAQRAFDEAKMRAFHKRPAARSEPEEFVEFADRIPGWCVIVGLIGTGQEIHVGEEGGLPQWTRAISSSPNSSQWTVHAAQSTLTSLGSVPRAQASDHLNLTTELRFHGAQDLHRFAHSLISDAPDESLAELARGLANADLHLRVTRSLDAAKQYLRSRYSDNHDARFGIIASSRDKLLPRFGVQNHFKATSTFAVGPWFGDDESIPGSRSCRMFAQCATEFGVQGLELDAALLAWGSDFIRVNGGWSNSRATKYKEAHLVKSAMQLRRNAYRVLLTRGRDATIIFVPPVPELDETFDYLVAAGVLVLDR